jgi:hypothetical protein
LVAVSDRRSSIPSYSQQVHRSKDLELQAEVGRPLLPGQERYDPPAALDAKAAVVWREFMDAMPAGWFGRETFPILKMLCRHIVSQEKLATKIDVMVDGMIDLTSPDDLKEMRLLTTVLERQTRIVATLATQLRLTPKSRGEYRKKDNSDATATNSRHRPWEEAADLQ